MTAFQEVSVAGCSLKCPAALASQLLTAHAVSLLMSHAVNGFPWHAALLSCLLLHPLFRCNTCFHMCLHVCCIQTGTDRSAFHGSRHAASVPALCTQHPSCVHTGQGHAQLPEPQWQQHAKPITVQKSSNRGGCRRQYTFLIITDGNKQYAATTQASQSKRR